jgi:hypothetical protein
MEKLSALLEKKAKTVSRRRIRITIDDIEE